jgi:hypothetical protein
VNARSKDGVRSGSADAVATTSPEALRAEAVTGLDDLLRSAAILRGEIHGFEASLQRARAHLIAGHSAEELKNVIDIAGARESLSIAAADFQVSRHASRLSIFRAQIAEGTSIGSIARDWGLSRQLVSRTLREDLATKSDD